MQESYKHFNVSHWQGKVNLWLKQLLVVWRWNWVMLCLTAAATVTDAERGFSKSLKQPRTLLKHMSVRDITSLLICSPLFYCLITSHLYEIHFKLTLKRLNSECITAFIIPQSFIISLCSLKINVFVKIL